MNNLDYIENYFSSNPGELQRKEFAEKIINDKTFAAEVSFYMSVKKALSDESAEAKKIRFREIYDNGKVIQMTGRSSKKLWGYVAAACLLAAVLLVTHFTGVKQSPQELAQNYFQKNLSELSVKMGNADDLQTGLIYYNRGRYDAALSTFENILKTDPANIAAKKYAGIVCLRMKNYDKALYYFTSLESNKALISNPGKFYRAITLMIRNKPGDTGVAKTLLQSVVDDHLEGFEQAEEWLKKLD